MALYVIGDTHLSEAVNKPMDIFGGAWQDYRAKLLRGLGETLVSEEDMLVVAGDLSWGMSLEEALPDFQFLEQFPGKKVLVKGNHDYWWETVSKMNKFFEKNEIKRLSFLHNNCIFNSGTVLCGTRGWFYDPHDPAAGDEKVFKREVMRLEASLKAARRQHGDAPIFCFLHYPPILRSGRVAPILELLESYGVSRCYYGHLHGESLRAAFNGVWNGVHYQCVSADYIGFRPVQIMP